MELNFLNELNAKGKKKPKINFDDCDETYLYNAIQTSPFNSLYLLVDIRNEELYNKSNQIVDLSGYFLTDKPDNLTKWEFPAVTVLPNAYLLVWASGKDRTPVPGELHANFTLAIGGEYLALVDPATNIISEFSPAYPAQTTDFSYGADRANPDIKGFFSEPTPGEANASSGSDFATQVEVSHESHTFTEPFSRSGLAPVCTFR